MATGSAPAPAGAVIRRRGDLIAAGVGLGVYLMSAVVASSEAVPAFEQDLFHLVNGLPDWLRGIAYPVQLLGVLVAPFVLAGVAALLRLWRLALALAVLPVLKYAVEYGVVKQTVVRARPFQSVCAEDPSCGQFRDVPLYGPAFVSGHAIIAGAVAVILLPYLGQRWRAVVVLLALAVALARVYLGAHNPLDVVGGIAVGVVVGSLINLAVGVPAGPPARGATDQPRVGP